MDRSLDDIISSRKKQNRQQKRGARSTPYSRPAQQRPQAKPESAKLIISNLAFSVTQKDLNELFGRIGQVKSAQLNFDANGKSKGSGTVVFAKKQDALRAVQEYNNRTLDNRPMKLELIVDASVLSSRIGAAPVKNAGRGRGRGGRGRGRGGRRGAPKSNDELDAEMDAYMNDQVMQDAPSATA